jgi:hypothetical protein
MAFDIIVTVEVKPHPGSSIMERPASANKIVVAEEGDAKRHGAAQMAGTVAAEAACALLGIETRPELLVRMAGFSDAELARIFPQPPAE